MHPQILARVLLGPYHSVSKELDRLHIQPAVLEDHARHRVQGVDYPAVIPEIGQRVQGTVVRGLTELDLMRLDAFEGDVSMILLHMKLIIGIHSKSRERRIYSCVHLRMDCSGFNARQTTMVGSLLLHQTSSHFRNYEDFIEEKLRNWIGAPETAKEYVDSDALDRNQDQNQNADRTGKAIKVGADVGGGSGGRSAFLS